MYSDFWLTKYRMLTNREKARHIPNEIKSLFLSENNAFHSIQQGLIS